MLKRFNTFAFLSFFILTLGGSGSVYAEKYKDHELPALENDMGRLMIYRSKSILGAGMKPKLYVDGQLIGKSNRATVGYMDMAPGTVVVSADRILYSGDDGAVEALIEAGVTTYVKISMGTSSFAGKADVEVINEEEALLKMDKLKMVDYEIVVE